MYNPVSDCTLPHLLSHQSVLVSEQFHRQFVVGHLKEGDDLVLEVVGCRHAWYARWMHDGCRRRRSFLHRRQRRAVFRRAVGRRCNTVVDLHRRRLPADIPVLDGFDRRRRHSTRHNGPSDATDRCSALKPLYIASASDLSAAAVTPLIIRRPAGVRRALSPGKWRVCWPAGTRSSWWCVDRLRSMPHWRLHRSIRSRKSSALISRPGNDCNH